MANHLQTSERTPVYQLQEKCVDGIQSASGRVGRVTDCGVRGLGFKSPGSILTSRTETSSLSRVVRDG